MAGKSRMVGAKALTFLHGPLVKGLAAKRCRRIVIRPSAYIPRRPAAFRPRCHVLARSQGGFDPRRTTERHDEYACGWAMARHVLESRAMNARITPNGVENVVACEGTAIVPAGFASPWVKAATTADPAQCAQSALHDIKQLPHRTRSASVNDVLRTSPS